MKRIVVIGGGFAGLSALHGLARIKKQAEIVLIDHKQTFDFLPMLPDIVGRGIRPEFLTNDLNRFSQKFWFQFINEHVEQIDTAQKSIRTVNQTIPYDYVVIASGSETNFYGDTAVEKNAYTLDSVADAEKILAAVGTGAHETIVVGGGGYTGIEIATNGWKYCQKKKLDKKVVIVERAPSVLGPLPEWMKRYCLNNLQKLGIDVFTDCVIERIDQETISLSNGKNFPKAMLIWSAGVKTADFVINLEAEKTRQGRISVDEFLRITDSCFIAGDTANFIFKDAPIRMGIQFAIAQGGLVAANIIRSIAGKPLKRYAPVDLGYIIPMANNFSCGNIFGMNLAGKVPTMLHYVMCMYRSFGLRNKSGMLKDLSRPF
ncbi:NAD(P)/FAD-dependent oxidoreductase [Candidatus Omnitrophota bacterium]